MTGWQLTALIVCVWFLGAIFFCAGMIVLAGIIGWVEDTIQKLRARRVPQPRAAQGQSARSALGIHLVRD